MFIRIHEAHIEPKFGSGGTKAGRRSGVEPPGGGKGPDLTPGGASFWRPVVERSQKDTKIHNRLC